MSCPQVFCMDTQNITVPSGLIYYDTSFVIELFGTPRNGNTKKEAQDFHLKVAQAGIVTVSSTKVLEEVRTAVTNQLINVHKRKGEKRKDVFQRMPNLMTQASQMSEQITTSLECDINHLILEANCDSVDFVRKADGVMSQYHIGYMDASHYLIQKGHTINAIATFDIDFLNIGDSSLVVFTDRHNFNKWTSRVLTKTQSKP